MTISHVQASCDGAYSSKKTSGLKKAERKDILRVLYDMNNPLGYRLIYFHDLWQRSMDESEPASLQFTFAVQDALKQRREVRAHEVAKTVAMANEANVFCQQPGKAFSYREILDYVIHQF